MIRHIHQYILNTILILLITFSVGIGKTFVFYEKGFPSSENGQIERAVLEQALSSLEPKFIGLADFQKKNLVLANDLLVLPYGSAFPAEAWDAIKSHLEKGNLLVLGGRPLFIPVYRKGNGWRIELSQNAYARYLGIVNSYSVPDQKGLKLQWDEDAVFFKAAEINPEKVYALEGYGGRYRGLGYLEDANSHRISAPIVAEDFIGNAQPPRRRVYLSFNAKSDYWNSKSAIELIHQTALYASFGGIRLWFDLSQLTIDIGDRVSGAVDVVKINKPAQLTIEVLNGLDVLESRTIPCGGILHEEVGFKSTLKKPGLYKVRATVSIDNVPVERYTSGICVRDLSLLHSGSRLEAGRDYFKLDGKPYLMVGANYFSTDQYTSAFFCGGAIGGNAWNWEKDFAEMEQQGLTAVRTGIWLNRFNYLDDVSKTVNERLLNAIEAYLYAAERHHMQVIFTFFAFDPQTEQEPGNGQSGDRVGPGSHPYLDPVALEAQLAYIRAIVHRFKDVPFLSYDLINEPSFGNPKRHWLGNSPNGDPKEIAEWQIWLKERYKNITNLAKAWRMIPEELGSFERVQLPNYSDFDVSRSGNIGTLRAVDYNLFAQYAFASWVDTIVSAIRAIGSHQAVTVGQDEGGVADRVLNQFWGRSQVDYTCNHSWWRDDALLWNSVAAKTLHKPNIIGETAPQPVGSMDGSARWDDLGGLPLLERKYVLSFANAGAGILHWDWTRSGNFGVLKRDGSQKKWINVLGGVAAFARDAQPYATESVLPEIALVFPQSLQLSSFRNWGIAVQQNAVRALYNHARATAFAIGEYQLAEMPKTKLIIVPAPWILSNEAWDQLLSKVRAGATLLISGRIDADDHWGAVPERLRNLNIEYSHAALTTRETMVKFENDSIRLSYSGDRTTYAERGVLLSGNNFVDISLGSGHILYFTLPLELADQSDAIGRVYRFAIKRSGVHVAYETNCQDPGILICPTSLPQATLYVLTSESANSGPIVFHDKLSNSDIRVNLAPGRAALLLVKKDGTIAAEYNAK